MMRLGRQGMVAALLLSSLAACDRERRVEPPPRSTTTPPVPSQTSFIVVPVELDASLLAQAVEQAVPKTLWSIDRHFGRCVPPQRLKVLGARIKIAPKIGCDVVGTVTRGPIRMSGKGEEIAFDLPLTATIRAKDVGGVLKGETATGSAKARAIVRFDIGPDWMPTAKVRLHYDWTREPGIDFLGQRITFTQQADEKLAPIVRDLERRLPRELARIGLRSEVETAWSSAFTTLSLNDHDPPVWLRLTPRRPVIGGYAMRRGRIRLSIGLEALTETFVGQQPNAVGPTPLPAPARDSQAKGLRFFIPVVADYAELEPVIDRALAKRSRRPFELPGVGPVLARFSKATVYATDNGRIAVGLTVAARPANLSQAETKGHVWLTARPVNEAGSAEVRFADLSIDGDTDGVGGDLVLSLAQSPALSQAIAEALAQNFSSDIAKLSGKIENAIAERREGDFTIRASIEAMETGRIAAYGTGLYLPVRASGTATVEYER